MKDYSDLNNILEKYTTVRKQKIVNETFSGNGISLLKIRDTLIRLGTIRVENLDDKIYIAEIKGGFAKKNSAIVLVKLESEELRLAAYAEEGLFNQHTCEGVIDEFRKAIRSCRNHKEKQ